ncbi:MAG: hypothetical protein A2020_01850 [Lentisphaerae bacterium GWF2_45_14]|nr:MAG: hypothetical protein A2020_01850 [Lentisphaerae bacterium GWF2_45_14]
MEKYKKQQCIVDELEKRIRAGIYSEKLPKSKELAAEFGVNFKTIDKAVNQMAAKGLLVRKRRAGTLLVGKAEGPASNLIELLFVGSHEMPTHPYYAEIWRGLLEGLVGTKYKLVLTMLEEDSEFGGLKKPCSKFTPSAAKILIGTNSHEQIEILKKQNTPFILIGGKPGDSTPAVYLSVFKALKFTLKKLFACGHKKIAYIGPTQSRYGDNLCELEKFYAYVSAVEETYGRIEHSLIVETAPFADRGYPAMEKLLRLPAVDAVYVAFDHLCPGVYRAIRERGLNIPDDISVLSTDGLDMHFYPELFSLKVDRYRLGQEGAKLLKKVIRNRKKGRNTKSVVIDYELGKSLYGSVKARQETS